MKRLLWIGLLLGCTDASLYGTGSEPNFANKISFEGELCTDDPSAVSFPVKVLLVMDGSAEMMQADPTSTRAMAIQALFDRYPSRNYNFGLLQFGAQARSLTGGFADDVTTLQTGLDAVAVGTGESQRSYFDALRVATTLVQDDILSSTPGVRSRTRYVVVLVSYGPPAPPLADFWCPAHNLMPGSVRCTQDFNASFCPSATPAPTDCERDLYTRLVTDLRSYVRANGGQDLVFHTISLRANARADQLLTDMALAGHGSALSQMPTALNLLALDIARSSSLLVRRELVVYNSNAVLRGLRPVPDSDGDGLSDEEEQALGTDPLSGDTDGDFVGDAIERVLAAPNLLFDPLTANVPPECTLIMPPDVDTDQDGLSDCEEAVLRTDASLGDSDRDGIPDLIEVRRGGNPLIDDLLADSDQDGSLNGDELKGGLDVAVNDAQRELEYGYRYRLFDEGAKMRLEATPSDPFPGVRVVGVGGVVAGGVGNLHFDPGPPAMLSWSEEAMNVPQGAPVDVSKGGTFTLTSPNMKTVEVRIDPQLLGAVANGTQDFQLLVRTTLRSCFHYDVRNITLVETAEVPGGRPGRGWNNLRVYLGEVPKDTLTGHTIYNVATAPVRFLEPNGKTPDKPFIHLMQDDFVLIGGP